MVAEDASGKDFGQEDIDNLFNELTPDGEANADAEAEQPKPASTDDDIDAILAEAAGGSPATPEENQDPASSDLDDIDAILAEAANSSGDAGGVPGSSGSAIVNQEELDSLLEGVGSLDPEDLLGDSISADNVDFESYSLDEAKEGQGNGADQGIELLRDVSLQVKIELGRANMFVKDVLGLNKGSVVELDRLAGDPLDILVNDRLVAKGEVLVLNDNFCIRVTEILSPRERADQEKNY